MIRAVIGLAGSLALGACVSVDVERVEARGSAACAAGLSPTPVAHLYFGRFIGGSMGVSDTEWQDFVDAEITPRFPDGLSVADVSGQWRGPDGVIVREPSKTVMVVLTGAETEQASLDAIRTAYVERFDQDAVMLIQQTACVGF
ncbi:DUF3574 domain-containing protein [Brevundimonas bacteroides]|uniref:DUF3574 domain-containing protein n=1 Tax=Brevundimonas bacteroides TaxID=74311 RepID=UPI000496A5E9|nr:DUF3574 domain-containing protein [Brevundimonas bacteroides]